VHSIINQLQEWKTGPKITNYVRNFMLNRKLIVRVGPHTSNSLPLTKGLPQGSPISIVLFLIAFNKLSDIISLHTEIKLNAYADDFFLTFPYFNKNKNINFYLDNLLNDIEKRGSYSGASLSLSKCQPLHICEKHNWTCTISCNNMQIPTVDSLNILGINIDNKYKWNKHINKLILELHKKPNTIKCLSSPHVVKATVIAKIDLRHIPIRTCTQKPIK